MKLVYLHGVGDGDVDRGWLAGLNEGLEAQKLPPISEDNVIAPVYADLLSSSDAVAAVPKPTPHGDNADVLAERAQFLNRQIEAYRSSRFPSPDCWHELPVSHFVRSGSIGGHHGRKKL